MGYSNVIVDIGLNVFAWAMQEGLFKILNGGQVVSVFVEDKSPSVVNDGVGLVGRKSIA